MKEKRLMKYYMENKSKYDFDRLVLTLRKIRNDIPNGIKFTEYIDREISPQSVNIVDK